MTLNWGRREPPPLSMCACAHLPQARVFNFLGRKMNTATIFLPSVSFPLPPPNEVLVPCKNTQKIARAETMSLSVSPLSLSLPPSLPLPLSLSSQLQCSSSKLANSIREELSVMRWVQNSHAGWHIWRISG